MIVMTGWNERNQPPLEWKKVKNTVENIRKRQSQEEITGEQGEGSSLFSKIEKLIYPDGDVKYQIYVDGFQGHITLTPEDFTSRLRFKTRFFALTDISPKLPKGDKWDDWLTLRAFDGTNELTNATLRIDHTASPDKPRLFYGYPEIVNPPPLPQ